MFTKKGIRVDFFLPSFEIGGAERNTLNLLSYLNKEDYKTSLVLAQNTGGFLSELPRETIVVNLGSKGYLGIFLKLVSYLKKEKPDLLVSAFPHFNAICLLAKKISKVNTKIVITEHTPFSLLPATARNFCNKLISIFLLPLLMKIVYPWADAVVCVSEGVKNDLLNVVKSLKDIKVVYNPIVTEKLSVLADEDVDHAWFKDRSIPIIIAVGRLAKAKDYPTLLRAIKIILKKRIVRLVVLGRGPEELKLKGLVKDMNLVENVDFLGSENNPYKYIKRSSVFVLSSIQEGFGNSIVEAMACAIPVVATNCYSGPPEILQEGSSGLLVPPQDEKMLAEAILKILDNPLVAEKLSSSGKKRSEYFSVERSALEYIKIFHNLIN